MSANKPIGRVAIIGTGVIGATRPDGAWGSPSTLNAS